MSEDQNSFRFIVRTPKGPSGGQTQGAVLDSLLIDTEVVFNRILQPPQAIIANSPVDTLFGNLFAWSFRQFQLDQSVLKGASVSNAQSDLALFNVIIALEWTPNNAFLQVLNRAFTRASDLLYDITDGYMAIGQVVIGGRELMEYADIQIFASNRFYPRTAVNGLTDPRKYQPIRLGRGLWDKQKRQTHSWDKSGPDLTEVGPGTIVHEWGHYALGMKDRYFRLDNGRFVVPELSPAENTIMASVKQTELLGTRANGSTGNQDASDWQMLIEHPEYTSLEISLAGHPNNRDEPLIPIPAFYVGGGAQGNRTSLRLRWEDVVSSYAIKPEHCWVYVVKGESITEPTGLIAQGTLEEPPEQFQLLGAEVGNFVVLVGNTGQGTSFQPLVLYAKIEEDTRPWTWIDATPKTSAEHDKAAAFPFVDITVTGRSPLVTDGKRLMTLPHYDIRVDGFDDTWNAVTFPLGLDRVERERDIKDLSALEGHVMLISTTNQLQITIASYSVGGSPSDSGFPGHPNPLPAGSAEGNAMLFFYDGTRGPIDPQTQYPDQEAGVLAKHYEQFKIVTVTNPLNDAPPPGTWLPCSYAFSVTSNESFKTLVAGQTVGEVPTTDLKPTLVLYYDDQNQDDMGDELTIGRYSTTSQTWDLITAAGTKHKPRKGHLISLALEDSTTAPGLFAEKPQAEHYRLFKKPAASS